MRERSGNSRGQKGLHQCSVWHDPNFVRETLILQSAQIEKGLKSTEKEGENIDTRIRAMPGDETGVRLLPKEQFKNNKRERLTLLYAETPNKKRGY